MYKQVFASGYTILLKMDFDLISHMNVDELKKYLRLRALKVSGRKEELVARVFYAVERNVSQSRQLEEELNKEYQYKLTLDEVTIPDPYCIVDGWFNEQDGIKFWRMLLYPDIFNYLP